LDLAGIKPRNRARAVEDNADGTSFGAVKRNQMLRLMPDSNAGALRQFDLYLPTVFGYGVMALSGSPVEIKVEDVGCDDFSDAAYEVPIEREFPSWE
jgi:hypothetical protein